MSNQLIVSTFYLYLANLPVQIRSYLFTGYFHMYIFLQTYVQDLLRVECKSVYIQIVQEGGHFYVCGDCTMAEHVFRTLRQIIQDQGNMTDHQVDNFMLAMRVRDSFFGVIN